MFIGKNLENIRTLCGFSRKELSDEIKVSEQAIWQYEVKNMMPEINKIYELSKLFNVKTTYFISEQPSLLQNESVDKHSIAFRAKNHKASTKILNRQYHQATYLSNVTNYLFAYVKKPSMLILDLIQEVFNEYHEDINRKVFIKKSAKLSRKCLMGKNRNNELLFFIEKSGIVVYEKNIDEDVDAFSFWSDNNIPYIVLGNNKGVAVRRNFDIAHELGHLVLHRHIQFDTLSQEEYKTIEKEADMFAAEFLLPEDEFIEDFNQLSKKSNPDHLKLLKEKWFVSIQAIGMRAYYLGLLSDVQYRYFWTSINKKGYKKIEPLDKDIKLSRPVKMNSLLDLFFNKKVISPEFLLDDLKVEPQFLKNIANIDNQLIQKYMDRNDKEKSDMITDIF